MELVKDFVENMSVLTIPRFILIDPAGKILLKVAPRPSEPEIRSVFDKILDGEHAIPLIYPGTIVPGFFIGLRH